MSKPKPVLSSINAYSVDRKDSGYFINRHLIQDGKLVSSEKVSEPNVLAICMATLEKLVRKERGL